VTIPQIPSYKSRRGWLIFFGVVEILIACVCLLLVVGTLLLPETPVATGSPVSLTSLKVLNIVLYGGVAVMFLVIGVGSIRCKNWARLAMIGVSGLWLTTGLIGAAFSFVLFPVIRQQSKLPPELEGTVIAVLAATLGFGFVLMPAVFLIFYSLKSVKATCSGPISSSGAASPGRVAVIVLAVLEGLGGLAIVSFVWVRVIVLFGVVLHGFPAFLVLLAHSIASGFAVWLILQRKFTGWLLALLKNILWMVSSVLTLARYDISQLSREMGFDEKQLQVFQQFPQMQTLTWIMTLASLGATVIFIWSTRRFFPRDGSGVSGGP